MSGRISAVRANAVRAAQHAKAQRDAERLRRERMVESALTDFYEQKGRAEQLRENASARSTKILAAAETAAREPEQLAREAIAALQNLGEPRDQIAELTGLSLAEVRAILAEVAADATGRKAKVVRRDHGAAPAKPEDSEAGSSAGGERSGKDG